MGTPVMRKIVIVLLLNLMSHVSWALDRYVSTEGNDANLFFCISPAIPCKTIQKALNTSVDNDTIKVAKGTYDENLELRKSISNLSVEGGWNSDFTGQIEDPSKTIINGMEMASKCIIYISPDEDNNISVTFKNFSITGGTDGAIYATSESGSILASFENNLIFGNTYYPLSMGYGVGAYSYGSGSTTIILKKNQIYDNTFTTLIRAGTDSCQTAVTLEDNNITGNDTFYGWSIYCINNGVVNIETQNNIIAKTSTDYEMMYMIVHNYGQVLLNSTNDTMANHFSVEDKSFVYIYSTNASSIEMSIYNDIWWNDGFSAFGSGPAIVAEGSCIITNPPSSAIINVKYSNIGGEIIEHSNCFASPTVYESNNINMNPQLNSKLHLKKTSPCIDSAICGSYPLGGYYYRIAPLSDIDGDPRPWGEFGCDMGADEYTPMVLPFLLLLMDERGL